VLGAQLQMLEVRGPDDFDKAFESVLRGRATAVVVPDVAWLWNHFKLIADLAAKNRLPSVGPHKVFAEHGGLLSYGPKLGQAAPRVAVQVDKILRGAKPGDLPVEQPTTFELVMNLKTAKALGLTIPPSVLLRADQVIE
jgi:putative ABC transport system substrate-binding protein